MLLREAGFKTAFITNSQSEDIRLRAERLKIDYVYEGAGQKGDVFRELCKKSHLKPDEILFIGDDIIDLPVFKLCGISVAPADAHPEVLKQAKIVTKANGGRGSVREICDILLHLKLSV
jgi:3-deoxy-D-manno-octulosonate 8-phosphate phosphatase (KDO 8-P phosphatase)